MNGAYGAGLLAFQRMFDRFLELLPWCGGGIGIVVLIWIACRWRDA